MYNEACEDICKISYEDRISHKLQNVLIFVASTHCVTCHRVDKFMSLETKPNMRVMQGVMQENILKIQAEHINIL